MNATPLRHPSAFLALWNGISSAALQAEYEVWHTFEHVPERVGLPGFVEARRYRREVNGMPHYFTCYWLDALQALDSPRYREVFAQPTPWSARMRTELRDFLRMPCQWRGSHGPSTASHLATLHVRGAADTLADALEAALAQLQAHAEVVSAQWGLVHAPADFQIPIAASATSGTQAVAGQDAVVLLHGLESAALQQACQTLLGHLAPVATAVTDPAIFNLLSQVRQSDLLHPLEERQPPCPSLRAKFT